MIPSNGDAQKAAAAPHATLGGDEAGAQWEHSARAALVSCNQLVDGLRVQTTLIVEGPGGDEEIIVWAQRVAAARARVNTLLLENEVKLITATRCTANAHLEGARGRYRGNLSEP